LLWRVCLSSQDWAIDRVRSECLECPWWSRRGRAAGEGHAGETGHRVEVVTESRRKVRQVIRGGDLVE
jgi:hypothetical protein